MKSPPPGRLLRGSTRSRLTSGSYRGKLNQYMRHGLRLCVVCGSITGLLVLALVACTSGGYQKERQDYDDLAWPQNDPRVKLDSIIRLDATRQGAARRVADHLTGVAGPSVVARPYAVVWSEDDLIVTDAAAGRVLRLTSDGRIDSSPDGIFESPVAVAVCDERILVTDSGAGGVAALNRHLDRVEWLVEGLDRPTGLACGGGQLFVVETAQHRILILEDGAVVGSVGARGEGEGEFNFPTAVTLTDEMLWVGDTLNFRVHVIDRLSGEPLRNFGTLGDAAGNMPRTKGLAVDSVGRLWITDAHIDQVAMYSPEGEFLMSLGGSGAEPGRFAFPAGVASHPDGRVAVVDSLNARVQIFRLVEPEGGGPDRYNWEDWRN